MPRKPNPPLFKKCQHCSEQFEVPKWNLPQRFCSKICSRNARTIETIDSRFWKKVDTSGGPDACWPYTGVRDVSGYGIFRIDGRNVRAHRVAYELSHGSIERDLFVLHACDNPPCCNPKCLSQGDHTLNMVQMVEHGRSASGNRHPAHQHPENRPRGEQNAMAKLTEADVQEIRSRYVPRVVPLRVLAVEYHVSEQTIHRVVRNSYWKHVNPAPFPEEPGQLVAVPTLLD